MPWVLHSDSNIKIYVRKKSTKNFKEKKKILYEKGDGIPGPLKSADRWGEPRVMIRFSSSLPNLVEFGSRNMELI